MLLDVRSVIRMRTIFLAGAGSLALAGAAMVHSAQSPAQAPQTTPGVPAAASPQVGAAAQVASPFGASPQRSGLNIVVLDPAHGGTDPGARGTGGIRESEIVLDLATQVRRALELAGFQVVLTRQGNENPSFDDRSAIANAQRGAVFVTLHISSTGLPGTVRVYVNSDLAAVMEANGLIPWDRAAAPAIAVEISSIVVEDRAELDRMGPGVADAIARGAAAFKPSYVVANVPGTLP